MSLIEYTRRRISSPRSDADTHAVKMEDNSFPMRGLQEGNSARGTVNSGAWSEHGSQEGMGQRDLVPDGGVMVRTEVRRGSESV